MYRSYLTVRGGKGWVMYLIGPKLAFAVLIFSAFAPLLSPICMPSMLSIFLLLEKFAGISFSAVSFLDICISPIFMPLMPLIFAAVFLAAGFDKVVGFAIEVLGFSFTSFIPHFGQLPGLSE